MYIKKQRLFTTKTNVKAHIFVKALLSFMLLYLFFTLSFCGKNVHLFCEACLYCLSCEKTQFCLVVCMCGSIVVASPFWLIS